MATTNIYFPLQLWLDFNIASLLELFYYEELKRYIYQPEALGNLLTGQLNFFFIIMLFIEQQRNCDGARTDHSL